MHGTESNTIALNIIPSYACKKAACREHWHSIVDMVMLKKSMPWREREQVHLLVYHHTRRSHGACQLATVQHTRSLLTPKISPASEHRGRAFCRQQMHLCIRHHYCICNKCQHFPHIFSGYQKKIYTNWTSCSSVECSSVVCSFCAIAAAVPPRPQDGTACFSHRTLHHSVQLCDRQW